jgi:hypothetical protein
MLRMMRCCCAPNVVEWLCLGSGLLPFAPMSLLDLCLGPDCSGACIGGAGRFCGPAMTSAAGEVCPMGRYSTGGQAECTNCPGGTFGNTTGLTSASCTADCFLGRFSYPGAIECQACDLGYYVVPGFGACAPCPAGYTCPAAAVHAVVRQLVV